METVMRGNISGRIAYIPNKKTHHRMAVEVNYNRSYTIAIVSAAILVLVMTASQLFLTEHIWMWRLMWSDTIAITGLCAALARRIRQGIV